MNFDFRLPNAIATSPQTYPYQSSISSSASSSSSSVFSVDATSQTSESSAYTSASSGLVSWDTEDPWRSTCREEPTSNGKRFLPPLRPTEVQIAPEQRQHPRRRSITTNQRPPPALVRQTERKGAFVDCLVDSATTMVEVIWPLSVPTCRGEPAAGQGVLPLRTFIQETLRRSRTSFSTLQVALYYLILIKTHVPKYDFTMEQPEDMPSTRALQCGRRMFLAALILASKYLQDRNYSARAWSKISGLKVCEINTNEMAFLQAVNWKLHVPEQLFERWQDTLITYTSQPPPSPGSPLAQVLDWKTVIPRLTAELDTVQVFSRKSSPTPAQPEPSKLWSGPPRMAELISSQESTPTPVRATLPRVLEPSPNMLPPTPFLARMGPLPTPVMTPQSAVSNTPAASLAGYGSRRPSMCSAMSQAQNASMARSVMDCNWNTRFTGLEAYQMSSRRPSVQSVSASSSSSPESMVSDHSRSSRASSISSASSVSSGNAWVPTPVKLARFATLRCAGLPYAGQQQMPQKEYETVGSITNEPMCAEPMSSPDFDVLRLSDSDVTAQLPLRTRPTQRFVESPSKGRKRGRSSVDLQQGVRALLGPNAKSYLADASSCVLPDRAMAQSLLLQSPCSRTPTLSVGTKALQSPARSTPERRLPVQKDLGRKRACCASEANIMRFETSGPGMWEGIL